MQRLEVRAQGATGRLPHSDGLSRVVVFMGGRRSHHSLGVTADRLDPGVGRVRELIQNPL